MSWLEQPEIAGGGVIFHTAVHLFDALRFITGQEIVKIRAVARNIYNPQLEDLLIAEAVLSNGTLAIVDTSKVSPARACRYEFVCEKGQLHGDQVHGILQKIEGMSISNLPVKPPRPSLLPLLVDWYAFLHGNGKNPISGMEGLAAVKICHACRESIASGQWVDIEAL
jgi:predicted dehydrogenase